MPRAETVQITLMPEPAAAVAVTEASKASSTQPDSSSEEAPAAAAATAMETERADTTAPSSPREDYSRDVSEASSPAARGALDDMQLCREIPSDVLLPPWVDELGPLLCGNEPDPFWSSPYAV